MLVVLSGISSASGANWCLLSVVGHSSAVSKLVALRSKCLGFESGVGQKFLSPITIL